MLEKPADVGETFPAIKTLGVGDLAPDFELPAADVEGTVTLEEFRSRGPVLLILLRGLYCPFCRRNISLLRPTCEALRAAGIALLGVVIASPERARQYFRYFPPCFPMAAAPDRSLHRAYGLEAVTPTPDLLQEVESRAADQLRDLGHEVVTGHAFSSFMGWDGFTMTAEDNSEFRRRLQSVGYFLIAPDQSIRWSRVDRRIGPLPAPGDILAHM